jgi:hypothetical protein
MTYSRFEDIPVWQEAIRLADGVYDMTESRQWSGSRSLRDPADDFRQELMERLPPDHPLRKRPQTTFHSR